RRKRDMEKMELQKAEGALGPGCLLMFAQLPFFYAFYTMLANAIELRHAHWLWIHDLSSPDPWHLLPILSMAFMFLATQFTPQVGVDANQRMMMNLTSPLMFGWITWINAAGLALYWTIGAIVGIPMQLGMNRTQLGRELREI